MKEERKQLTDLIVGLATGASDPTAFAKQLQSLNSVVGLLFDTVEELETEKITNKALFDGLTTEHETLKTKYHEKWESEGGEEDHTDPTKLETPKVKTEKEVFSELETLSKGEE